MHKKSQIPKGKTLHIVSEFDDVVSSFLHLSADLELNVCNTAKIK